MASDLYNPKERTARRAQTQSSRDKRDVRIQGSGHLRRTWIWPLSAGVRSPG